MAKQKKVADKGRSFDGERCRTTYCGGSRSEEVIVTSCRICGIAEAYALKNESTLLTRLIKSTVIIYNHVTPDTLMEMIIDYETAARYFHASRFKIDHPPETQQSTALFPASLSQDDGVPKNHKAIRLDFNWTPTKAIVNGKVFNKQSMKGQKNETDRTQKNSRRTRKVATR